MAFNPVEALRQAGIVTGDQPVEVEQFYASLSKEETETLISITNRLTAVLPDVVAHSQEWSRPEATQDGFDAALLCACGAWSGSGSGGGVKPN